MRKWVWGTNGKEGEEDSVQFFFISHLLQILFLIMFISIWLYVYRHVCMLQVWDILNICPLQTETVSTIKSLLQLPISHHNFSSLRKKDASQPEQEHPLISGLIRQVHCSNSLALFTLLNSHFPAGKKWKVLFPPEALQRLTSNFFKHCPFFSKGYCGMAVGNSSVISSHCTHSSCSETPCLLETSNW